MDNDGEMNVVLILKRRGTAGPKCIVYKVSQIVGNGQFMIQDAVRIRLLDLEIIERGMSCGKLGNISVEMLRVLANVIEKSSLYLISQNINAW